MGQKESLYNRTDGWNWNGVHWRQSLRRLLHNVIRQTWSGVKTALDFEFGLEDDEFERLVIKRPKCLKSLCRLTQFTESQIKRIYRGFKNECPTGIAQLDQFCEIYSRFFGNSGLYAKYFFNTLDPEKTGLVTFDNFVMSLSILSFGTLDEKLSFIFRLYDINGDGFISRDEMTQVITSVFQLMGNSVQPPVDNTTIEDRVNLIFQKMDLNSDGVITFNEFLEFCTKDKDVCRSMSVFSSLI